MNIFTGVEKNNDDFKDISTKKVEKRQEALKDCKRVKRSYGKRRESFWKEGGKQKAANKVVRVSTSTPEFPDTTPHQQSTLAELKKMKATELLVYCLNKGEYSTKGQGSINKCVFRWHFQHT